MEIMESFLFDNVIFVIVFPLIIMSYVYLDAKKRNMDEFLWLILIFFGSYFAFIAYLIARVTCPILECFNCKTKLKKRGLFCSKCGLKFFKLCPVCSSKLDNDYCKKCSSTQIVDDSDFHSPVKVKDNFSNFVSATMFFVLVILTIAAFYVASFKQEIAIGKIPFDSYTEKNITNEFEELILEEEKNEKEKEKKAYVLEYETKIDDSFKNDYLIYLPNIKKHANVEIISDKILGLTGAKMDIELKKGEIIAFRTLGKNSDISIFLKDEFGGKCDYEVKKVDYPLFASDMLLLGTSFEKQYKDKEKEAVEINVMKPCEPDT